MYVGLIFFGSSRPYLRAPGPDFANKDKIAHCTEYGILGWFMSRALRPARPVPAVVEVLWFVALGAGVAGIDELFQGTVAGRVTDIRAAAQRDFLVRAGRELVRLLSRDLIRLEGILSLLRG